MMSGNSFVLYRDREFNYSLGGSYTHAVKQSSIRALFDVPHLNIDRGLPVLVTISIFSCRQG